MVGVVYCQDENYISVFEDTIEMEFTSDVQDGGWEISGDFDTEINEYLNNSNGMRFCCEMNVLSEIVYGIGNNRGKWIVKVQMEWIGD